MIWGPCDGPLMAHHAAAEVSGENSASWITMPMTGGGGRCREFIYSLYLFWIHGDPRCNSGALGAVLTIFGHLETEEVRLTPSHRNIHAGAGIISMLLDTSSEGTVT